MFKPSQLIKNILSISFDDIRRKKKGGSCVLRVDYDACIINKL